MRSARIAILAVLATALIVGPSASGDDRRPGIAAGVRSVIALPPEASLPLQVRFAVDRMAVETGTDRASARANVRRLRSNLGVLRSELYAFRARNGSVCWILTDFVGSCPDSVERGSPGLQWTIGGGYDHVPGRTAGSRRDGARRVARQQCRLRRGPARGEAGGDRHRAPRRDDELRARGAQRMRRVEAT